MLWLSYMKMMLSVRDPAQWTWRKYAKNFALGVVIRVGSEIESCSPLTCTQNIIIIAWLIISSISGITSCAVHAEQQLAFRSLHITSLFHLWQLYRRVTELTRHYAVPSSTTYAYAHCGSRHTTVAQARDRRVLIINRVDLERLNRVRLAGGRVWDLDDISKRTQYGRTGTFSGIPNKY